MDVLIIDDEAELAASMVEYLSAFDVQAVAVGSAEEGLAYLARTEPGLILLDVNLPGMNGFTFTRQVRARTQVPILFVSARGSDDDQVLALGVGGDDYITKPFSLAVLLAKVKRVLARETPAARTWPARSWRCRRWGIGCCATWPGTAAASSPSRSSSTTSGANP